jgi:hypothetical protein
MHGICKSRSEQCSASYRVWAEEGQADGRKEMKEGRACRGGGGVNIGKESAVDLKLESCGRRREDGRSERRTDRRTEGWKAMNRFPTTVYSYYFHF